MDIVFVILHYKTHYDTIECIESIKKTIDTNKYGIVIVDNASNNGSLNILYEKFGDSDNIKIVSNSENIGFARGLNVGIRIARLHWKPKFIAAINNDTILLTKCMVKILYRKYAENGFAVAGPMIITKDGYCNVNPIRKSIRSIEEVEKCIKNYRTKIVLCDLHILNIYNYLKRIFKKDLKKIDISYLDEQIDYKLHGCFWIFSEKYFECFEGLDESTFLYGEEDILYIHIIKNGLHTFYTPDIVIYHKEDSAANVAIPHMRKKVRFISENSIKSLEIYCSIYKKYAEKSKD